MNTASGILRLATGSDRWRRENPGQYHYRRELPHRRRIGGAARRAADSTVVGVPGHIVLRDGKRVVITDPKEINDPLSEALAAVATEVKTLREQVSRLEGREHIHSETLEAAIEMDYQI